MRMDKKVHYSSDSVEWATPPAFFDELNKEFNFTLDVCASKDNAKCESYFDKETDGLKMKWEGTCWMNPPYGRDIPKWMAKAIQTSKQGHTVVCLVHSRTDTKWFHEYAMKGELRFVKGRLKFKNPDNPSNFTAPFPSLIVIFRPDDI